MFIWDQFVRLLVVALFALAQASGGLGLAIVMFSLSVRLALLPLTLRMARRAQERQMKLLALEPMIKQLRARYRSNPQRLQTELLKLYRRHGYSPTDLRSLRDSLIQLPIVAGLYTAIKRGLGAGGQFFWISNLARPDALLALLVGTLVYFGATRNPGLPQQTRFLLALIPALLSVYAAFSVASGVSLYFAASAAVGVLETALVRPRAK